ncbi:hypothetical protein [Spirosoma gilvum]
MALLNEEWIQQLGPPVLPFERTQFKRKIEQGEDIIFTDVIHLITAKGSFDPITVPVDEIVADRPLQGKYLWIIDEKGLKIIPESTPNPYAGRRIVCHTNITGGAPALQGGELWFGDDDQVYLNYRSGRYGAGVGDKAAPHKLAVIAYFRLLGFDPVQLDEDF